MSAPSPSLGELALRLGALGRGELDAEALRGWLHAVLAAEPLGVSASEAARWEESPDEARLFWRLVYLFEDPRDDAEAERRSARRIAACLERSGSAADTLELLPLLEDQDRLCAIVRKHAAGVISRTGFLSVIAESGYPDHVKLWLEHADATALGALCDRLERGDYGDLARVLERAPGRE